MLVIVWRAVALALVIAGGARTAAAAPCNQTAWMPSSGTRSAGSACQVVILTTDASNAGGAVGRMTYAAGVAGTGRYAITVQRLTAPQGSIQLNFPGGWLVLGDGQAGVYTSEAQWAAEGYRRFPAALAARPATEPRRIELDVGARRVVVRIDGLELGQWAIPAHPKIGQFSAVLNGPRGVRARVRISAWVLPLPA